MAIAPITVGDVESISKINKAIEKANAVDAKAEKAALEAETAARAQAIASETAARALAVASLPLPTPVHTRPGEAAAHFTTSLAGGDPGTLAPVPQSLVRADDAGLVVRMAGDALVGSRALYPVEPSKRYLVEFAVQRRVNSPDPDNDAIRCGLAWYGQTRVYLSQVVVQDLLGLTTGSGRKVITAVVSRATGDDIDVTAPAGARYARPFVQTYGTLVQSDVEIIRWTDITDAAAYSPDLTALEARTNSLESVDAGDRLDYLESQVAAPNAARFKTRADAAAADIPVTADAIELLGDTDEGDGLRGLFVARDTGSADSFTGLDGRVWYREQSTGPTYPTKAVMGAVKVQAGMNSIRVNGLASEGDTDPTSWVRVPAQPDVPGNAKFRSADRYLPDGSTSSANGGWWMYQASRPRADQMVGAWTPQKRMDFIAAKMAAGETVNIAVFGDSTVDGNTTTGWTANPVDGDGNAVGATDHASTAPNAWPAKLQKILREMFGNTNIVVWNAGYSGRRLADGWARSNYRKAVIDNPAYGVPDLAIISFGLNDITPDGSQVATYTSEMRLLARDILSYGSIPAFASCSPAPRNTTGRDNRETSKQIDTAKFGNSAELDVPFIDIYRACLDWLNGNADGFRWFEVQPDYLHFGDAGHAFVAGYVATHFNRDIVRMDGRRRAISPMAPESGSGHDSTVFGTATSTNGKYAGNWVFLAGAIPAGTATIDAWVWCETPKAAIVYRGFDGDSQNAYAAGLTAGSKIEIASEMTGVISKIPAAAGFARPAAENGHRRSDMPSVIGKLSWGLNRVRYLVGSAQAAGGSQCYLGHVELMPFAPGESRNALKQSGPFVQKASSGSGLLLYPAEEADDGCNIIGPSGNSPVSTYADLVLPVGSGFVFALNASYGASATVKGDKSGGLLYRYSATEIRVYPVSTIAGVVGFGSLVGAFAVPSAEALRLRLSMQRSGDNQVFSAFTDWATSTAALTVTIPYTEPPLPFGGVCGGLFFNRANITGTVLAEIKALMIASG